MVTFASGVKRVSYSVRIVNDNIIESNETFTASLSTDEPNVNISDGMATVTILDEDSELFM